MDLAIKISIPNLWGEEQFVKNEWGGINYLVGPNATGKTRFAEELNRQSKSQGLKPRYLSSERLAGLERQPYGIFGHTNLTEGLNIGQFQEYKNQGINYGLAAAAYSGSYHIAVNEYSSTRAVNFHLYCYYQTLQYLTASSSFTIPADSPSVMSIGAVSWDNPTALMSYSSRGPTEDNRVKPDLVAPANVSTTSSGGTFGGTSAATPHAAGAAVLVKDRFPSYTPAQIQSFLENRAIDLGDAGKDNLFGSGRLYLGQTDNTPPTMEAIAEAEGQYYNTAPTFSTFGFDDNMALDEGIDPRQLGLSIEKRAPRFTA